VNLLKSGRFRLSKAVRRSVWSSLLRYHFFHYKNDLKSLSALLNPFGGFGGAVTGLITVLRAVVGTQLYRQIPMREPTR
tara:strand:- start:3319 stop:3555 length:237 start_codon:yes stop_codon:yes gene_type:complete